MSFELRATMSLSKVLADQGLGKEALNLIEPVYARFSEGFDSADLVRAKELIAALTAASTTQSSSEGLVQAR